MATIVLWVFFIIWGLCLIQSLGHRNLPLAFDFAFQMYVVREFVIGNVEPTWTTILSAIFSCWLVFVLGCIPGAIRRNRWLAQWERAAKTEMPPWALAAEPSRFVNRHPINGRLGSRPMGAHAERRALCRAYVE